MDFFSLCGVEKKKGTELSPRAFNRQPNHENELFFIFFSLCFPKPLVVQTECFPSELKIVVQRSLRLRIETDMNTKSSFCDNKGHLYFGDLVNFQKKIHAFSLRTFIFME